MSPGIKHFEKENGSMKIHTNIWGTKLPLRNNETVKKDIIVFILPSNY